MSKELQIDRKDGFKYFSISLPKMKTLKVAFCIFLLWSVCNSASAAEVINLSKTPSDSQFPQISIDPDGHILVVWEESDWPIDGIADILYSLSLNEEGMVSQESLSQLYDARSPHLVSTPSDGRFHLVYEDGPTTSKRDIFSRSYDINDGYWSNIAGVERASHDDHSPYVSAGLNREIFTIWIQEIENTEKSRILLKSRPSEGIWLDIPENISGNTKSTKLSPKIQTYDADVYVCWMDDLKGSWDIIFAQKSMGLWESPASLDFPGEKKWPSFSVDLKGRLHLLYSTPLGNTCYVQRTNGIWSSLQIISTASSPSGYSDLVVFKNNTLHAAWIQEIPTGVAVYYGRASTDGQWLESVKVASGTNSSHPKIELDNNGDAHIVWEDTGTNGQREIFYTKVILPGERPTAFISCSSQAGIAPFAVTLEATSPSFGTHDIINFWWDFGDGSKMEEGGQVTHTYDQPGDYLVKLYATNAALLSSLQIQAIKALSGPFPPLNIQVKKMKAGGLLLRENINALTWEPNPKNEGLASVVQFCIYRKSTSLPDSDFAQIAQVDNTHSRYADRNFIFPEDRDRYAYAVSAVDTYGREGPKELAVNKN